MSEKGKESDRNENPLDPLEVAQREGRVFGLGLKGSYRKNKVIAIGFLLLGLCFFLSGLGVALGIISLYFSSSKDSASFISAYVTFLICIGFVYIGARMIIRVIKK